jgi:tryptophan synthase alpha chain
MTRIDETFARCRTEGRPAFVAFVTVGYPEIDSTVGLVKALVEGGADIIELGVPCSDPLADGPKIQESTFRALQNGTTPETCLDAVRQLRAAGVSVPLVFMGYYNPILAYGLEKFAKDAAEAGADGIIPVDLPPEESADLHRAFTENGLSVIYLLAPTSTDERIKAVAEKATGFVYCVSLTGVTGVREELPEELSAFLERVRKQISLPLAVGFGISQPKHFQAVGRIADAVVIGSAIIDVIARSEPSEREGRLKEYAEVVTGRRRAAT